MYQLFFVHISLEKSEEARIAGHFGFVFEKNAIASFYRKAPCFRTHKNANPEFSNLSRMKNIFQTLRFRHGLMWTVGLTGEIKVVFFKFLQCSVDGRNL